MTDPRSKIIPVVYADGDCGTITAGKAENAHLTADLTQDGLKWRRLGPRVVALLRRIEFVRGFCPDCLHDARDVDRHCHKDCPNEEHRGVHDGTLEPPGEGWGCLLDQVLREAEG